MFSSCYIVSIGFIRHGRIRLVKKKILKNYVEISFFKLKSQISAVDEHAIWSNKASFLGIEEVSDVSTSP